MAFKNALRILVNRFGLAWVLALYTLVLVVLIGSLSLVFILPVVDAFTTAGIFDSIGKIFADFWEGVPLNSLGVEVQELVERGAEIFEANGPLVVETIVMFFVVLLIYKFLLGFYELPMYRALDGAMSSNARLGFVNLFISSLSKSWRFVLVKILYTTAYDTLFAFVLYCLAGLLFTPVVAIFAPLIISVYIILFQAFRYTLIAFWGPQVAVNKGAIFKSFTFSTKKAGKNFASVFSSFIITWVFIIALNLFIGIFTFGAGLILTIPVSMLFILILNMTQYYNKTGRRYYADGEIITPPNTTG